MKIRDKFLISASISVAMIIVIGFIFYSTAQEINKSVKKEILSQNIIADILDLNTLRADYALNPGERSKIQWFSKYESLGKSIKKAEEEEEEEWGAALKGIHETYSDLKPLFSQLVDYTENPGGKFQEFGTRLSGQMLIKSQEIVSVSQKLSSIAGARALSASQRMFTIIIVVIVTGIVALINSIFVFKSTVKPISQLYKATESLAKGKFDARIDIKTGDEFEELGKSFNRTAEAMGKIDEEHRQIDEAKTQFIAISSHELRSPMTPMKANIQMLLHSYFGKLNKKQKESLELVLRNTNHLDKIIVDLLELSRIGAGRIKFNFVRVDLPSSIKNSIKEMEGFIPEKHIRIIADIGKLPKIEADPNRISQVLRNLLSNAIKFSKANNKIILRVHRQGGHILFSVQDFGIGIPEENKPRIFEPFFQGEQSIYREYKGTGLGLAICKGIVKAQNGKIWFESSGQGSTFWFTVPVKPVKRISPIETLTGSRTQLEEVEKLVAKKMEEMKSITQATDQGALVSMTDLEGNITLVNDRFCEVSKYTRKELIGKNHRTINSGFHTPGFFKDKLWGTITKGGVFRADIRNRAKDGSIYWVRSVIMPAYGKDGKIKGYSSVRTPITDKMGDIEEGIQKLKRGQDIDPKLRKLIEELRTGEYKL